MVNPFNLHRTKNYHSTIARFLLFWMCGIIISGIVFMHKEVTSTGEIVTHVHPYRLGEKKHHKHQSDAEIRYLDILYHVSNNDWSPITYIAPVAPVLYEIKYGFISDFAISVPAHIHCDRGPPSLFS